MNEHESTHNRRINGEDPFHESGGNSCSGNNPPSILSRATQKCFQVTQDETSVKKTSFFIQWGY